MGNSEHNLSIGGCVALLAAAFLASSLPADFIAHAATVISGQKFSNNSSYTAGIDGRFKAYTGLMGRRFQHLSSVVATKGAGGGGAGDITTEHFNDFSTATQGKLNQKATLRANAQFGVISSAEIQATSQSGRGVYGRSNTFTGVKGESVSGVGVGANSDISTALSAISRTGSAGIFSQAGVITSGPMAYPALWVQRTLSGTGGSISGHMFVID